MKRDTKRIAICVAKAKKYLASIDELKQKIGVYQADIAEMALEICTIRHGGISNDIYTIKDYAKDIGMNFKTLQNWVSAYRNVVPIVGRDKINCQKDWSDVRKTSRDPRVREDGTRVGEVFAEYVNNEKPFLTEFNSTNAGVKHLKYMLGKRDLSMVNFEQWLKLMQELDNCSDIINEYLTKNKNNLKAG
ncbi:MAG: hypothetical protein V3T43_02765 [Nitrosomonadaceae bacterium]